ncbi:hypothetical protein KC887_00360 [Candidatus Kaiserbacteria bacterium]|nr:hypothetical protein [Candidatus Kaiserbacteria bacterium]
MASVLKEKLRLQKALTAAMKALHSHYQIGTAVWIDNGAMQLFSGVVEGLSAQHAWVKLIHPETYASLAFPRLTCGRVRIPFEMTFTLTEAEEIRRCWKSVNIKQCER